MVSTEMLTVRLHGPNDLRLHAEPLPVPAPGELLLRTAAVGICASDLHWFCEGGIGDARLDRPLVLGHEFSAIVESDPSHELPIGQRLAVDPAIPCRKCEYCQRGHPNLCTGLHFAGHSHQDGALRQWLTWPKDGCHPLPDTLSDADGAMLEPLGVAIHAVDLAHLKPGMTIGVFGCGPIGLLVLQVARLAGASRILATDPLPHRLETARRLGAETLPAAGGQEIAALLDQTTGRGVDIAFETAGDNPAVETAVETTCPGGRVVLVGIPDEDRTAFRASSARRKGLTIALVRRMKHTYPRAIHLVERGLVDVRSLVSHSFPLDQAQAAFSVASRREGMKIIIQASKT